MDQAACLSTLNSQACHFMHHDLQTLLEKLIKFRDDRDWAQFQTPKNLALSISLEAAELEEGEK